MPSRLKAAQRREAFHVEGVDELRKSLKNAEGSTKRFKQANRKVGKHVETTTRGDVVTPQQRKAVKAWFGGGDNRGAFINLRDTAKVPYGIGAFMGAKYHAQFPAWVGNDWSLAEGTGPYVLRDVFKGDGLDDIKGIYLDELDRMFNQAGLDIT